MAQTLHLHQSFLYKAVACLLAPQWRTALIHLQEIGKRCIAFKRVKAHLSAVVLWLAPCEYIYQVQRENLRYFNLRCHLFDVFLHLYVPDDRAANIMTIGETSVKNTAVFHQRNISMDGMCLGSA